MCSGQISFVVAGSARRPAGRSTWYEGNTRSRVKVGMNANYYRSAKIKYSTRKAAAKPWNVVKRGEAARLRHFAIWLCKIALK